MTKVNRVILTKRFKPSDIEKWKRQSVKAGLNLTTWMELKLNKDKENNFSKL
jgi:hypothetical protein